MEQFSFEFRQLYIPTDNELNVQNIFKTSRKVFLPQNTVLDKKLGNQNFSPAIFSVDLQSSVENISV